MNLLEIHTTLIGGVISDAICTLVIGSVWLQHRRRFPRLDLWTVSVIILALRGSSRIYRHKFWSAVRALNKENGRRVLQRWGALPGCAFFIFWYISFVYYKNGAFKSEHTLPLIRA
jgi:hypothetical protein